MQPLCSTPPALPSPPALCVSLPFPCADISVPCDCHPGLRCRRTHVAVQHFLADPLGCASAHRHESARHAARTHARRCSRCLLPCAACAAVQSRTLNSQSRCGVHDVSCTQSPLLFADAVTCQSLHAMPQVHRPHSHHNCHRHCARRRCALPTSPALHVVYASATCLPFCFTDARSPLSQSLLRHLLRCHRCSHRNHRVTRMPFSSIGCLRFPLWLPAALAVFAPRQSKNRCLVIITTLLQIR